MKLTDNGINNMQTVNRLARKRVTFESCGTRAIKEGINLYIERQKHKLDQIAARNIKIYLDKRTTTALLYFKFLLITQHEVRLMKYPS